MPEPVYLDHAATTPLDPAVLDAMRPYLTEHFGNASSVHALGRRARVAVEEARERVAGVLGCGRGEVVFTSGGTEGDNAALRGTLESTALSSTRPGLVTSEAEHEAILQTAAALEARGHPVARLMPGPGGAVAPEVLADALDEQTGLVSLMLVNNEVGTVTDLASVSEIAHERNVLVHTDAVQAPSILPLDVEELGVDLLTLSGHKVYGPKGVGVLYVRAGTPFEPLVRGGAQEASRRGGTENVAAAVGFAEALVRAEAGREAEARRVAGLRQRLFETLRATYGNGVVFNTPLEGFHATPQPTAPHILSISFPPREGRALDGEMLLLGLDMEGVYVSSGSACASGALTPSHVLLAMGRDRATAAATVRFSLGRSTDEAAVDYAAERLAAVVQRMAGAVESA